MRPKILLLLGDTAGIGPELCSKVICDLPPEASDVQIILVGDIRVFFEANSITKKKIELETVVSFDEIEESNSSVVFWNFQTEKPSLIPRAEVSEIAGREVLSMLMESIKQAKRGAIDGFVFAPFNKESMHLAGSKHYSELELFKQEFDRMDIPGEFNILDNLWLSRATSHIPFVDIVKTLNIERIAHTIKILGDEQGLAGLVPHLAVAALNPHAGEHGLFGDEEEKIIKPAVCLVQKEHPSWKVEGPFPADTLFPRAMKDGCTGIVGMYHDQLQIATKLIGMERGVSFHPGMPVPIATAAHGTAFDIQGSGTANHEALKNALSIVIKMVLRKNKQ